MSRRLAWTRGGNAAAPSGISTRALGIRIARRRGPRTARNSRQPPLSLRARGRALQPHGKPVERLRPEVHGRGVLVQGLPDLGWDARRGDRPCRTRSRRRTGQTEAGRRRGHAHGRRAAREYAGRRACVLRLARGRRAVPRGPHDRGFPCPELAHRLGTDIGLDPEERATLSLLRSWRIRKAREAA
jgi:hypothetical protein